MLLKMKQNDTRSTKVLVYKTGIQNRIFDLWQSLDDS